MSRILSRVAQHASSIESALKISGVVFFALLFLIRIGGSLYSGFSTEQALEFSRDGIRQDLAYLKTQGDAVARLETVKNYLQKDDSYSLLGALIKERDNRSIGLMGVANKEGYVVSRTKTVSKRGDNVFLTAPQGRVVAQGKDASSIELSSVDPTQIVMTTGRPITDGGAMIGGLFASYLMDDAYAARFQSKYLPTGTEVVFYTKNLGIYGNSMRDTDTRKIVESSFNVNSDWIKNGTSDQVVRFPNGSYYTVKNIVFYGLEASSGGALLFIPLQTTSGIIGFVISIITFFLFLSIGIIKHSRTPLEDRDKKYHRMFALISLGTIITLLLITYGSSPSHFDLKKTPYTIYNSTLRLQPEFGVFDGTAEQRISIIVDTGGEDINSVGFVLAYDPSALKIEDVLTTNSFCRFFAEKDINETAGIVRFTCALPSPGLKEKSGVVARSGAAASIISKSCSFEMYILYKNYEGRQST